MPVAGKMPSRNVRRCLFGPVDHEARKVELAKIKSMLAKRDSTRWNFDFEKECPKGGRFLWEIVHPNSPDIPRAYELGNMTPMSRLSLSAERLSLKCKENDSSSLVTSPDSLAECSPALLDPVERPSTPVRRKRSRETEPRQTLITEYFLQRKNLTKRRKVDL